VPTAIVVGSGPNGLAAAAQLACAGFSVTVFEAAATFGGGTRSAEKIQPGLIHDECAAFHPLAVASPIFNELQLNKHGLEWCAPPIQCVHPFDDGSAAELHQSVQETARLLGKGGASWSRVFGPMVERFDDLLSDIGKPVLRIPNHPILLSRFGMRAALPAAVLAKSLRSEKARALWMGVAAHALYPLTTPFSSSVGMSLVVSAHAKGWPVAKGGSQSIANALASIIRANGGVIETNHLVTSINDLPPSDVLMLDVSPRIAADILGDSLPTKVAAAYRRYKHGAGAFKIDFAVDGGVPWRADAAHLAGTVHLGGSAAEVVHTESLIHRGTMPDKPFVLVGQQYVADASRSNSSVKPVWTYAHVPHGYDGDATELIINQIERFAPGFRERIVGSATRSTTEMTVHNPNYIGGDIIGGQASLKQLLFRPRITLNPYSTGVPGVYLCSASTPPGAGAHGLCGANAADQAIQDLN
jgi:phytoene dehydrogenase-like protein